MSTTEPSAPIAAVPTRPAWASSAAGPAPAAREHAERDAQRKQAGERERSDGLDDRARARGAARPAARRWRRADCEHGQRGLRSATVSTAAAIVAGTPTQGAPSPSPSAPRRVRARRGEAAPEDDEHAGRGDERRRGGRREHLRRERRPRHRLAGQHEQIRQVRAGQVERRGVREEHRREQERLLVDRRARGRRERGPA